jgi:Calcineurin-like phosphoesterase
MRRAKWHLAIRVAVVLAVATVCSLPLLVNADNAAIAPTSIQAAWVELGPGGVAIARLVTAGTRCPRLYLDTHPFTMPARAQPAPADFPVLVCEMILPSGITSAVVDGLPLPLPKTHPQRLVVIGDTGCRLKDEEAFQACNDAQAWPFESIARSAARWQPDLVIHVGDYHYREAPCPPGNVGCAGSPWGDNWPTWKADFFAPAAELLRAAPWVVARGNHEACNRAGRGWFRFLDPQLPALGCQDYTPPYAVPLGEEQLLVLDSAGAPDDSAPSALVAFFANQFAALRQAPSTNAWLVTHRPIWGSGQSNSGTHGPSLFQLNATLQAASGHSLAPSITLVLAGHLHLFELLRFAAERPPQLIVGNGGTALDPAITSPLVGREIAGASVVEETTQARFGFLTLERSGRGWVGTVCDVDGNAMVRCTITDERVTCGL